MSEVTILLEAANRGDPKAAADLLPLVYDELRKLAAAKMAQEKPGQTLDATALVHEAYLRLVPDAKPHAAWDNRGHFFAAAAEAMRRILVENARRRHGPKRGGHLLRRELDPEITATEEKDSDRLLAVHEALERFAAIEPRAAELVKLRYFVGMSIPETAQVLGISPRTADNDWAYARAWLINAIRED